MAQKKFSTPLAMDGDLELWMLECAIHDLEFPDDKAEQWNPMIDEADEPEAAVPAQPYTPNPPPDETRVCVPQEEDRRNPLTPSTREPATRTRLVMPLEAHREMKNWILGNITRPFLTRDEENYFMAKYAMTRQQVRTAFNNRRQRVAGPIYAAARRQLEAQLAAVRSQGCRDRP
jgi:hypothetical protein